MRWLVPSYSIDGWMEQKKHAYVCIVHADGMCCAVHVHVYVHVHAHVRMSVYLCVMCHV